MLIKKTHELVNSATTGITPIDNLGMEFVYFGCGWYMNLLHILIHGTSPETTIRVRFIPDLEILEVVGCCHELGDHTSDIVLPIGDV